MAATPGQLFERVADTFAMPLVQVKQMDRFLADAGLRTKTGGRGRNAPKVSSRDAAHLLIAAATSRSIKDAAEMAHTFGQLPFSPNQEVFAGAERLTLLKIDGLSPDHTFADGLAAIIDSVRNGDFDAAIRARGESDPQKLLMADIRVELFQPSAMARIEVYNLKRCLKMNYDQHPDYSRPDAIELLQKQVGDKPRSDLQHISAFGLGSIRAIADLLGPEAST
ncbi:hypothetical protein [Roseinatronobacter alkalisoli]|uniref:Uncharacterized protein n=1 Tax=Roseinatronobacter alkalisoli TaxID=3028235 RepID=A0ABT5T8F2_9RHOB|nr:hypothetical protein [Roseinatronobacter sp. HJB301]MDD7970218.1 hypothetical protein [Roseinatronobacter sp. HJB301]